MSRHLPVFIDAHKRHLVNVDISIYNFDTRLYFYYNKTKIEMSIADTNQ